jgi:rSAM/selenodomain-associated transferase 2
MKLSIVIPVLNEAQRLPSLLKRLLPLHRHGVEIVIVDGGSDDGSPSIAEYGGFTVLRSARGRARQMNAGAVAATGDVLLFLHADTLLPEGTPHLVARALVDVRRCWGRFDVRISGRAFALRMVAALMNGRSRLTGIATGDQAIFMTRAAFESVGGFLDQPLMEDIEMSRRLLKLSRPACIPQRVTTSGRRWESRGVWRTILLMWRLRWAYWRGVSPEHLAALYR